MRTELQIPPLELSESLWTRLPISERSLLIALQEVKIYRTHADAHGADDRVTEMLRQAGESPNRPWSAAFVAWCLKAAQYQPPEIQYLASPLAWITWSKATRRFKPSDPQRGDLFFYDRPGVTHLGFVMGVYEGRILTLEGNVFLDGKLDGPTTASIVRSVDDPDGYIQLARNSSGLARAA